MATVVFDVRANHDTGVSRYGLSILAAAAPRAVNAGWQMLAVARPQQENSARRAVARMGVPVLTCPDDGGFIRDSPWLRALLRDTQADLYYSAHYMVDRLCPVPFVYTIHDLTRLRYPHLSYTDAEFADRFGDEELAIAQRELDTLVGAGWRGNGSHVFAGYFRAASKHMAQRANRITTISQSTADDVRRLLGVQDARLDLVPGGVDGEVFRPRATREVMAARARHGLFGPYVFYTGLAHPNKCLGLLIGAVAATKSTLPAGSRLVLAGGHAERSEAVHDAVARERAADLVVFAGRVSDDELAALYTGASAYVTATASEGFGLPMLEASACGTQVIATDIPVLRETLGNSAHFYPAGDVTKLSALAGDSLRGQLPEPESRPPAFDWEKSGAMLVHALARALDESAD